MSLPPRAEVRLALAIPTYNRSTILGENLRAMLPDLKKHGIPVYISDDSTNAETEQLIKDLSAEHGLFFYRKNEPRLGHDKNFFATLGMANADYVWYLGDSIFVHPGGFEEVLSALEHDPDFCFANAYVDDKANRLLPPDEVHPFLLDKTWYLTLSGASIYGRRPRALQIPEERRAGWKNFPQIGQILEYCSTHQTTCYWIGKPIIGINVNKKSYWDSAAFNVFVHDWATLIRAFPRLFSERETEQVIKSHGINTGLFKLKSLLRLRANGTLDQSVLKRFKRDFNAASPISPLWASALCLLPQAFVTLAWESALRLRKLMKSVRGRT